MMPAIANKDPHFTQFKHRKSFMSGFQYHSVHNQVGRRTDQAAIPNIVTYERGIKNLVAGKWTVRAHRLMIGAKITTGVLFKKAEIKATEGNKRNCALIWLFASEEATF